MTDPNPDSILDSVKKVLGLDPDYTEFDLDVVIHINSAISTLHDLGVGPLDGFVISDNTATWDQLSPNMLLLSDVKTFIYIFVRLIFDPPATSFVIDSIKAQLEELKFRINVRAEAITKPLDPTKDKSSPYSQTEATSGS